MKQNFDAFINGSVQKLEDETEKTETPVSRCLETNKNALETAFGGACDIAEKAFVFGENLRGFVFYLSELIDEDMLAQDVLRALLKPGDWKGTEQGDAVDAAGARIIPFGDVQKESTVEAVVQGIVHGRASLFLEGCDRALTIDLEKRTTRSIPSPEMEASVFGPHQAFVEDVKINLSLIRNIIRTPLLMVEPYTLRHAIQTPVYLLYLKGRVNAEALGKMRKRLDAVRTDLVLDSASLKEQISDRHVFPFNVMGVTDRPDKTAAKIMEGKIALLVDGSPMAITAPYVFIEEFHAAEDYCVPSFFASFSRIIRFLSFVMTLFTIPLYIAVATFHQEMLPLTLLATATASREGIPFPTFVEAFVMTFVFDILREGGIRAPHPVGQTIGFIGALIIGTAAVDAGIISAPMVILIALTGITAILNYHMKNIVIFYRLVLMTAGAFFGLLGVEAVLVVILTHMCSIQSFGIPYLSPAAPLNKKQFLRDTLARLPLKLLSYLHNPTNRSNA